MLIQDGWRELEALVKQLARGARSFKYVPNQGNAGDALIAAGTWQLFEGCGLNPKIARPLTLRAGDTVIYAGGGNLVSEYNDCKRFLNRCLDVGVKAAVVLPHTIRGHDALLKKLDERFTLVCRDQASVEHVKAAVSTARVMLAPDMALRIDVQRLFKRCGEGGVQLAFARDLVLRRKARDYWLWRRHLRELRINTTGVMTVIRTDVEAVPGMNGLMALDISRQYISKFRSRNESDFVARDLLAFVGKAKRVHTNRLHVGIAGALMGCEVTLMDNSYGKIRACL